MTKKLTWIVALTGTLAAGAALATPPSGFSGTTIAKGRFGEFAVRLRALLPGSGPGEAEEKLWLSFQRTKGDSDVYVQSNVWAPGGTTGWHSHPGHSLIIVTAGTVTAYDGDDPTCTPEVYTAGMGFVDPGGTHIHVIRNEGSVEAKTVAVQLVPADATRRIDAGSPGTCPF